jgi:hypothetical protein
VHKTLLILALLSVGCTHAVAGEYDVLKLYPLDTKLGACTYQLKGTKNPETRHLVQNGMCLSHDAQGRPQGVENCEAIAIININKNQMTLRKMSIGEYSFGHYGNDEYAVEMEVKDMDCEEVSVACEHFFLDAVVTVKKGFLQRTFEMYGECKFPD